MTDHDDATVGAAVDGAVSSSLVLPPPADPVRDARDALAQRLLEDARRKGLPLVGPDGVLGELTKRVLELDVEVEMTEHLGYEKHAVEGCGTGNSRNGTRSKTVLTYVGPVTIEVPRDRNGTFEPQTIRKRQRRLEGVDSIVLSLSARSMTTGEISAHLAEVYGAEVSRETISKITDTIVEEMTAWSNRPLDPVYPVLFIDAIHVTATARSPTAPSIA